VSVIDRVSENRAERRKRHTRDQIKQAALDVMAERGYRSLTVQAITERADVGYGTFYLHFKDKDEIVAELLEDIGSVRMAELEIRLAGEPPLRREYLAWIDFFQVALDYREMYLDCFSRRGSAYLHQRIMDYTAAVHIDNIERRVYTTNGLELPIEFMAQFMTGAIWRLLLWWLEAPETYTVEGMARNIFEMVYRQPPPNS
jgi:AcrR family transcriptional regulator